MAESKEERDRKFIKDWVSGMTDKDLAKKYKISISAVRRWKYRIRVKDLCVYKSELREKKLPRLRLPPKGQVKKTHKKREKIKRRKKF